MSPAVQIALLWLAFGGSHLVLSHPPVRRPLVKTLGAKPFQGLYSAVALGLFVPLVWIYVGHRHEGRVLWAIAPGPGVRALIALVMGVAFVLLVASFARPSPAGMMTTDTTVRGVHRITRHPLFMALGLFGLAHLPVNGAATDVAFFAGFPLFALIGSWHQDQRKLQEGPPGYAGFHAATPLVPFAKGDVVRAVREMSPIVIGLGLTLAVAFRYWLHPGARW